MSNEITRIFSISTQSKRIEVNHHSILPSSREVIFTKNNRHYCTVWINPQCVDALIEEFLAQGALTDFESLTVI
jgi:hypothetical protein